MPTFRGRVENREIRLFVAISIGSPPSARTEPKSYPAILDTGAQGTMISQKVVDEGKLSSIGFTDIIPVSGDPIQTEKYRVRVDIPIGDQLETPGGGAGPWLNLRGKEIEVSLLPFQPENFDVLLGMDFLSEVHFTMYKDEFILSI